MAIVQYMGKPDMFITITCNPSWPEITFALFQGEKAHDRPTGPDLQSFQDEI